VSAQPSRAVALLEEHELHHPFVPDSNDIPWRSSALIDQNTRWALKIRGSAELDGPASLPAWKLVLLTDLRIFRPAEPGDPRPTCGRRRKAASRTVDPGKMQPRRFSWCTATNGIGRFLKLENLAISANPATNPLVVQYADGTLRVAGRPAFGSLGRYGPAATPQPEF